MTELEFQPFASGCLAGLPFDATETLQGIYRRRRRRQAEAVVRLGGAATAVVVALVLVAGGGSGQAPPTDRLEPFVIAAVSDAPTLASVDGLSLTYLPEGADSTPVHDEVHPAVADKSYSEVLTCFVDDCRSGVGVAVSRGEGLTIEDYLRSHWVGTTTRTTVNGYPALALNVRGDDAAGVMWSPSPGIVVEIHVGNRLRSELRPIVEGLRLSSNF